MNETRTSKSDKAAWRAIAKKAKKSKAKKEEPIRVSPKALLAEEKARQASSDAWERDRAAEKISEKYIRDNIEEAKITFDNGYKTFPRLVEMETLATEMYLTPALLRNFRGISFIVKDISFMCDQGHTTVEVAHVYFVK